MELLRQAGAQVIGSWSYFWNQITHLSWDNPFYWLIGISIGVWCLELYFPWRKDQKAIRKDFFLDAFYMFFNYFFFYMLGFAAIAFLGEHFFIELLASVGIEHLVAFHIQNLPNWLQLLLFFILIDFTHWNIHRLLHRYPSLWRFHKLHHSVEEMGFAAHLRFHWMEGVIYKVLQYIPIALIGGFQLEHVFIVHLFQSVIGHLNHANIPLTYGPFKYLLNNPQMHIWHHAKDLKGHEHGVNFGLSLSIWDYLFGTAYIPSSGRDIPLGFEQSEHYPKGFLKQFIQPFKKK